MKFAAGETRVGDWVVAVGNPFGLGGTVTAGIVSARGRDIGAGPYDDFIQIDAAVNRGNSGGPAFNLNGEVVGINTAIFSPSGGNVGIAFAIPASTAERVIDDLKDHGTVVRGWLGVQIQPITQDIADSLQPEGRQGRARRRAAGRQPGGEGRHQVRRRDPRRSTASRSRTRATSPRMIAGMAPGTDGQASPTGATARATTSRSRSARCRPPTSMASADDQSQDVEPSSLDDFGLPIAPSDDNSGVVVTDVDPNGQAAEQRPPGRRRDPRGRRQRGDAARPTSRRRWPTPRRAA